MLRWLAGGTLWGSAPGVCAAVGPALWGV